MSLPSATDLDPLLTRIHATPHRMTMNFAGAGAAALYWLHSVGGSSRTVLEATDRYTPTSLIGATGFTPKRFTSARVAKALASSALARAQELEANYPLFGLGCTATIATDRAKRGQHRCAVAVKDALGTALYTLTLTKGKRTRKVEEELVSLIILKAVAEACGVLYGPDLPLLGTESLEESFEAVAGLEQLGQGATPYLVIDKDGGVRPVNNLSDVALLSGSFNPLHEGHRTLAKVASERLDKPVYFELPLVNADKAPITLAEARRRALQFAGFAPVILSRAPLFSDKAAYFPNSTFVLGADTAARLVSPRFYKDKGVASALETLKKQGAQFLVAGRSSKGDFKTLGDLDIPDAYRTMFVELPETAFHMDISSTELREQHT